MQFRHTPNSSGYSPSELLNSRQITNLDILLPSPAHKAQGRQAKQAAKSQQEEKVSKVTRHYQVRDPIYALYFGPRRDQQGRWVPAVITKLFWNPCVWVSLTQRYNTGLDTSPYDNSLPQCPTSLDKNDKTCKSSIYSRLKTLPMS